MAPGKGGFAELYKLRDGLNEMKKDVAAFIVDCIRELANRLLAKTVPRTPVDMGELRRGWTIGEVVVTSAGAEIEVFNPVYYSPYVEYGHRTPNHKGWVEGRFMMTISIEELERELPAILEKKMSRFIEKYLGR
ncbi:HK97 gp10 family phage protein [Paenibacillus pinisoli]|uniref:HK97 gp10 family phage protein n=1 Tax=Paenibacillus pinisoli TaxID=1276110 RepID=UPI001A9F7182|nr:HK97 gp10 family phage protein [Paenibacillus pinisoli]